MMQEQLKGIGSNRKFRTAIVGGSSDEEVEGFLHENGFYTFDYAEIGTATHPSAGMMKIPLKLKHAPVGLRVSEPPEGCTFVCKRGSSEDVFLAYVAPELTESAMRDIAEGVVGVGELAIREIGTAQIVSERVSATRADPFTGQVKRNYSVQLHVGARQEWLDFVNQRGRICLALIQHQHTLNFEFSQKNDGDAVKLSHADVQDAWAQIGADLADFIKKEKQTGETISRGNLFNVLKNLGHDIGDDSESLALILRAAGDVLQSHGLGGEYLMVHL